MRENIDQMLKDLGAVLDIEPATRTSYEFGLEGLIGESLIISDGEKWRF